MNSNENEGNIANLEDGSVVAVTNSTEQTETIGAVIADLGAREEDNPGACSDAVFEKRIDSLTVEIMLHQHIQTKVRLLQQVRGVEDSIEFLHMHRTREAAAFLALVSKIHDGYDKGVENSNEDDAASEAVKQLQVVDALLHHHRQTKEGLLLQIGEVQGFIATLRHEGRKLSDADSSVEQAEPNNDSEQTTTP